MISGGQLQEVDYSQVGVKLSTKPETTSWSGVPGVWRSRSTSSCTDVAGSVITIAVVRQQLWPVSESFCTSLSKPDPLKVPVGLFNRLLESSVMQLECTKSSLVAHWGVAGYKPERGQPVGPTSLLDSSQALACAARLTDGRRQSGSSIGDHG